ncbi:MAG: hypothetical protein ACRDS9_08140 [Pseudonocardiaceae bacterium]
MNRPADGGGSGELKADHESMLAAGNGLVKAGETFDSTGKSLPSLSGMGPAAGLISGIVATYADTGMKLSAEAQTIGDATRVCSGLLADADADAASAIQILEKGISK